MISMMVISTKSTYYYYYYLWIFGLYVWVGAQVLCGEVQYDDDCHNSCNTTGL